MNWKIIILWKNFEVDLSQSFSPLAPGTHLDLTSPCKSLLTEYPSTIIVHCDKHPLTYHLNIIFSAETHLSSLCLLGSGIEALKLPIIFITQHIPTSSPQVLKEYSPVLTNSPEVLNKYSLLGAPPSAPALLISLCKSQQFFQYSTTINCQI